jgi:uncharacterized protein (TIGR04255 family)
MKLPKEINPCPIVEAVVEIRFSTNIHSSAVFGIVYNKFKDKFPTVEKLPILDIPDQIREKDPNLIFKPYFTVKNSDSLIKVGPRVLTINQRDIYKGWGNYSVTIYEVLEKIKKLNIITTIKRLGIRYTNFFEGIDIFEKINLKVLHSGKQILGNPTFIRIEIPDGNFSNLLQIANKANYSKGNKPPKDGSIIDIDTVMDKSLNTFFKDFNKIIEEGHFVEKKLFFGLLNPGFLKTLNPIY